MKFKNNRIILFLLILGFLIINVPDVNSACIGKLIGRNCCDDVGDNCCGNSCNDGLVCGTDGKCKKWGPPPPPPQCPTEPEGCYKEGNGRVDAGTLKPAEFDFYRVQKKCIKSGNCNCPTNPALTENPDEVRDPDARQEACGCIKSAEYNSVGNCCGNDAADCGRNVGRYLCRMGTSISQQASWVDGNSNFGDSSDTPCDGASYLSNNNLWIKCDGTFRLNPENPQLLAPLLTHGYSKIVKVKDHEYLCRGYGPKAIVECCGSGTCQSKDSSILRLTTGQNVTPIAFTNGPRPSFTLNGYTAATSSPTATPPASCGNGRVDANEECDGTDRGGKECRDISGFSGGTLECYPNTAGSNACKFDTTGCTRTPSGCRQGEIMCRINNVDRCWTPACSNDNDCCFNCPNWMCKSPGTCNAECVNTDTEFDGAVVADITGDVTSITGMQAAQTGTVRGQVWTDINQNGILDSGESGIGRVNVRIINTANNNEVGHTNTDGGTGNYQIANVPISTNLRLTFEVLSGYRITRPTSPCGSGVVCSHGDASFTFSIDSSGRIYNLGLTSSSTQTPTTPTTPTTTSQPRNPCTSPIGSCDAPPGEIKYENDVRSAISSYISNNGQIANKRNDDFSAVKDYLNGVAARLRSNGFEAARTKNCNDNEAADAIIVRKSGDQYGEYYGIIINVGSGIILRDTANIGYIEKANWNRALPQNSEYGNNMIYYCRADGTFSINLDTPGNMQACTTAGFTWTGTKCCGEYGVCEYHNENGGANSCWNITSRPSVSLFENNAVILYGGNFHGCAIEKTNYFPQNNLLLKLFDKGTNNSLITNHDYCFNDPPKDYFCSYTERWLPTEGKDRARLSNAPQQNPRQAAECCAATECWNGMECIANQRNKPLEQPLEGFRCIDGEWKRSNLKCAPDGEPCAYCPEESQCMINPLSQSPQTQCANSGDYSRDNYCDNGIWSTRTKLVALKLLAMKSSSDDFTLFCDDKDDTLNNLLYVTESGEIASSIIANLDANNFCIMKSGNKIIVGTSINNDISQVRGGFNIFGVTSCANAGDDNNYYSCDSTNKVWYNKKLKSLIYSATSISVTSAQEQSSSLSDAIRNIINKIRALITPPPFDESYVNSIKKFDKLYLAKQGSKYVRGALEGKNFKNAVIEYNGFDNTNICAFTDSFNRAGRHSLSGISCRKEGNNYYVLVQGSQLASLDPESVWPDLTAKLRLR